MYCTDGFGYGYYWHYGNLLFMLTLLIGAAVLVSRLFMNSEKRVSDRSVAYHSAGIKNYCPSCGKIIKTDWAVCPYCETKLK
ncbi:hypothetical protein MNBD_IGNAVI01-518 [hydrothermal vent metagenome]|uniref:Putative zinc-ribbon domain-containing protein n=1 Tax=hydrothermal vent metagenome TaxID=652676 RepID=A0A3B1CX56_9ZZZZ